MRGLLPCPQHFATLLLGKLLTLKQVKSTFSLHLLLLLLIRLALVAQLAHTCPYDNVLAQWPSMEVAQSRFPGCCAPEFFDCRPAGGGSCIPLHMFHDGHVDCVDGSDEFCFPGQIRCGPYCANTTHLGECLRNPYCDPLTTHTTTHMLQIIIPAITQAEASFCPLLKRKLCGLPNTISCKGYGECISIKWLMDGKRDCLDGSDEEPSYAALFKVLAYVGNPIHPAVIALLGTNPVPTQPPFVPVPPISPIIPIQPEVHAGVQPVTQRPYYWLRTTTPYSSQEQPFWIFEGTTKASEPVESTGTKTWQGPIVDDFGYPFGPSTFAFTSRHTTTGPPASSTSTIDSENVTVTSGGHKPAQEGWLIFPPPPITGNQPAENGHKYSPSSTIPTPKAGPESVPLDSFYPVDVSTSEKPETTTEKSISISEGTHLFANSSEKIFPFVPFVFTFPPTASTTTMLARETTTSRNPPLANTSNTPNQSNISSTTTDEWTEFPISPFPNTSSSPTNLSSYITTSSAAPSTQSSSQSPFQPLDGLVAIVPVKVGTLAPAVESPPCSQPGVDCALPTQNSYGGLQWPMGPARPFVPWSRKPDLVSYTTPRNPFPEEIPGSASPAHSIYTIQPSPVNPETQPPEVWVPEQSSNNTSSPSNTPFSTRPTQESESLSSITGQTMTSPNDSTMAILTSSPSSRTSEIVENLNTTSSSTQAEKVNMTIMTTQELALTSSTTSAATSALTSDSGPYSHMSSPSTPIPSEDHYPVAVWPAGVNLEAYNSSDKFSNLSTKNCTEKLKQMAKDLAPHPMCECPPGRLKDVSGRCVRADISTFKVRLARFCGTRAYEFETEKLEVAVILMKLSAILQIPVCVRDVDDVIIVNTECGPNCTLEQLNDKYVQMAASVMPDMDVKIIGLDRSGCYQFDINDCDEKAQCIPQGLRYKCHCLPGTNDTDGTGTQCEGVVISQACKQILGVCILVWVMMFLLLCFMIPILIYFWIKYCKGGEFIRRLEKWKQSILGKKSESTQDLGSGDVESAPTTPAPVPFRKDSVHPKIVAQDTLTVPLPVSLKPKSSAVLPVEPPKDYYIVENVEEGEAESPSDDESISSSEYTAPVRGGDTTVPVEVHQERPGSAQSRAGTPTIWETYQILGAQYSRFSSAKRRKSSTHSLDSLIRQREQEALEQLQARRAFQSQSSSIPEEESSVASSPKRVLSRQQTTTVIGGDKTPTTSVSTPRIIESIETKAVDESVAVDNILSAAAQRVGQMVDTGVDRVEQQEIPADSTSVYAPTPPPTTPAKSNTPSTSTSVMMTSQQDPNAANGIDLDLGPLAISIANGSIPSNRIPLARSNTQKRPATTTKHIVRSTLQTKEGSAVPFRNRTRRTVKSTLSQSTDSDSNIVVVKARPQWRRPNASPYTVESGLPPLQPLSKHSHPITFSRREDINSRLPPLPSGQLVSRSLTSSTRQLSNISEERNNEPSDLDKLPVSLSCPTSGKLKRKSVGQLDTPKKLGLKELKNGMAQSSISSQNSTEYASSEGDEPDFIAADIDLDLPGPYMIPASSVEEARRYSVNGKGMRGSKEEIEVKKGVPAGKRVSRRDDFKLPPINGEATSRGSMAKPVTKAGTLATKIASRRAVGGIPSHPIHRQYTSDSLNDADRMMKSARSHIAQAQDSMEDKVHSGCLTDREPWDSSPVREGEIERIPLDWNMPSGTRRTPLTTITGLMVAQPDGIRRVKSSGDLMISSNASSKGRQVRVTFDEHSIEFKERKKSRSLNDFYGTNRPNVGEEDQDDEEEPSTSRSWAKKEQMEWFEKLKNSLESKSWLDYD